MAACRAHAVCRSRGTPPRTSTPARSTISSSCAHELGIEHRAAAFVSPPAARRASSRATARSAICSANRRCFCSLGPAHARPPRQRLDALGGSQRPWHGHVCAHSPLGDRGFEGCGIDLLLGRASAAAGKVLAPSVARPAPRRSPCAGSRASAAAARTERSRPGAARTWCCGQRLFSWAMLNGWPWPNGVLSLRHQRPRRLGTTISAWPPSASTRHTSRSSRRPCSANSRECTISTRSTLRSASGSSSSLARTVWLGPLRRPADDALAGRHDHADPLGAIEQGPRNGVA